MDEELHDVETDRVSPDFGTPRECFGFFRMSRVMSDGNHERRGD
jgi:hypothetical protein